MPAVRWARGKDVDAPLAVLAVYADDEIRHEAVEAIGWRLRKRGGPADSLIKGLKHRDPTTQFLSAEGLARSGRDEGLSILLAAIDLQEDFALRQRAVQALGELGDRRAYDLLLKIVNDPEHALRISAVEALGRVGRTGKAHEILQLLEDLARGIDQVASGALRGLRWFDHPEGWEMIRRLATNSSSPLQSTAIELIGYDDEPASRDILKRLLAEISNSWMLPNVLTSARRLWGQDSLEPDYFAIQNVNARHDLQEELFRRLQEQGDAKRMLEILPRLEPEIAERVKDILLRRQPLPVEEAKTVVAGPDAMAAGVAAHLLGRAGATDAGSVVATALQRWWKEWEKKCTEETRRGGEPSSETEEFAKGLQSLIWAAGRLGGADALIPIATSRADWPIDRTLRRSAVAALANSKPSKAIVKALDGLAADDDPEVRTLAAEAVVKDDPRRAGEVAKRVLDDRVAFNRVARHDGAALAETLHEAGSKVHYQGIAVPHLAARNDVASLAAVAGNGSLSEDTRLGAVEGLAAAASEAGEAELVKIGQAAGNPEELRKAAWRGLRRSKRARKKREQEPAQTQK